MDMDYMGRDEGCPGGCAVLGLISKECPLAVCIHDDAKALYNYRVRDRNARIRELWSQGLRKIDIAADVQVAPATVRRVLARAR